jgi:hypothetical protein
MGLVFLVAAVVLFIIGAVWAWPSQRQLSIVSAGLACWAITDLISAVT